MNLQSWNEKARILEIEDVEVEVEDIWETTLYFH